MKLQANKTRRLFEDKTGLVLWSIIVILFVVLAISSDVFLSTRNFQSMALQIAPLGLLSLGMMFALVSGGINLGLVATGNLSCINIFFVVRGNWIPARYMPTISDIWWNQSESAYIYLKKPGGFSKGTHKVELFMSLQSLFNTKTLDTKNISVPMPMHLTQKMVTK